MSICVQQEFRAHRRRRRHRRRVRNSVLKVYPAVTTSRLRERGGMSVMRPRLPGIPPLRRLSAGWTSPRCRRNINWTRGLSPRRKRDTFVIVLLAEAHRQLRFGLAPRAIPLFFPPIAIEVSPFNWGDCFFFYSHAFAVNVRGNPPATANWAFCGRIVFTLLILRR